MVKMQNFSCADLGEVRFNSYNCCNILNTTPTFIYQDHKTCKVYYNQKKNSFWMYTIYDNIIQKNQFSTTTNNVKVIQSS